MTSACRCLHARHPRLADRGGVPGARREVETVSGTEFDVAIGGVERDGAFDAEEDLVIGVFMFPIPISRVVGPGMRRQSLSMKSRLRIRSGVAAHR